MNRDLFGQVRLGYALAESNRLDEWQRFGVSGLGLHLAARDSDSLAFRMDEHERRLIIRRGPAEDMIALGWQVDNESVLEEICKRMRHYRIPFQSGSREEARLRGVEDFVTFTGPKGMAIEIFAAPLTTREPLSMETSGFRTGAGGMGHVAIATREPEAQLAFWQNIFNARISDYIEDRIDGIQMDFIFLHLNERHHTVALAFTRGIKLDPLRTQIHHLNLQAAKLDDVTAAYMRCRQLGYSIANGIGQHPNDRELSFYVVTPSGFEIEFGWEPIVVPEDKPWQTSRYRGISLWGHYPENKSASGTLQRVSRALASIAKTEFTVHTGGVS